EYGIHLDRQADQEIIARLRSRPIRAELASGLEGWAHSKKDSSDSRRLRTLARAIDEDEMRNRLRDARYRNDIQVMKAIAAATGADSLPAATLVMLGRDLHWQGAVPEAVALLRRAVEHYPDDYWVNFELANALRKLNPCPWAEVIR